MTIGYLILEAIEVSVSAGGNFVAADEVEAAVNGGLANVYQTVVIVLVVVMIFLGMRTGLIVGSFVPLTMLMGLIVMRMFDIELEPTSDGESSCTGVSGTYRVGGVVE